MIREKEYKLMISKKKKKKMLELASQNQNEICGVLIGKKISDTIISISEIINDDKSLNPTPFSVTRNTRSLYPYVKVIVDKLLEERVDFLGDWHSHPNGSANLSETDKNTLIEMLADPDYFFLNSIVLIIVSPPKDVKSYLFKRGVDNPKVMTIIIQN